MVPFRNDAAARRMHHIALMHETAHLYVLHPVCQPKIVDMDPLIEYPILSPSNVVHENVVGSNEEEEEIVVEEAGEDVVGPTAKENIGGGSHKRIFVVGS